MSTSGEKPEPSVPTPARPEFPFVRTVCACRKCSICCEHIPGTLAPSDLNRIAAHQGYPDPQAFARDFLLAGNGATLKLASGQTLTLQKLVPRRNAAGACIFYQSGRCAIHAVSPFGCAYFDAHMSDAEHILRHDALSNALLDDLESDGPYARTVVSLRVLGKVAPPAEVSNASLLAAMRREADQPGK